MLLKMDDQQIERVKPIVQDGIDLYVSEDQKESGMSVRGLPLADFIFMFLNNGEQALRVLR